MYEEEWITSPLTKEIVRDIDKSEVLDSGVIDSPVLGKIPPVGLSGGVKTLILIANEPDKKQIVHTMEEFVPIAGLYV